MTSTSSPYAQPWMGTILRLAAVYNLLWGMWVIFWPNSLWDWLGMARPNYPQLWQCIGMIVGVYGIGYALAARDPIRHMPIVLVGFLGKIFGPIGFAHALIQGDLPIEFGLTLITNDLIWWVPFFLILRAAWLHYREEVDAPTTLSVEEAMDSFQSQDGRTLRQLSDQRPLLLLFLRHFG